MADEDVVSGEETYLSPNPDAEPVPQPEQVVPTENGVPVEAPDPGPTEDSMYQAGQRVEHWAYNVWDYLKSNEDRVNDQAIKHLDKFLEVVKAFEDRMRSEHTPDPVATEEPAPE